MQTNRQTLKTLLPFNWVWSRARKIQFHFGVGVLGLGADDTRTEFCASSFFWRSVSQADSLITAWKEKQMISVNQQQKSSSSSAYSTFNRRLSSEESRSHCTLYSSGKKVHLFLLLFPVPAAAAAAAQQHKSPTDRFSPRFLLLLLLLLLPQSENKVKSFLGSTRKCSRVSLRVGGRELIIHSLQFSVFPIISQVQFSLALQTPTHCSLQMHKKTWDNTTTTTTSISHTN